MPETVTITINWPGEGCDLNKRPHRGQKIRDTKAARRAAWVECLRDPDHRKWWKRARVDVTAYHRTMRFRDRQNIMAMLKASIDGVEDAGVIEDDSGLEWGPVMRAKDAAHPRVVLVFTEVVDGY